MQVFKLYFKILRRYMGILFMYIGIFLGVVVGVIVPQTSGENNQGYTQTSCAFAVFDYDESELSQGFIDYLDKNHKLKTLPNDDLETIQDYLYNTNVDCVIHIEDGFENSISEGNSSEYMKFFSIPNTQGATLLEQQANGYLTTIDTYLSAGFTVTEAIEKTTLATETSVDISFLKEESNTVSSIETYYRYLPWVFICMCVSGLSAVLQAFDKQEVRNRIECSSYKFVRMNMEIVLGVLLTGIAICASCIIVSAIAFPNEFGQSGAIFYVLNTFCTMAVALAITLIVSKVAKNPQVVSLLSNIIGLGMAFLCGVFVPLEYLSDTVVRIAHFLPVYWNVKTLTLIRNYQPSDMGTIFTYLGIQLLFAVALTCIGLVIARKKRGIKN